MRQCVVHSAEVCHPDRARPHVRGERGPFELYPHRANPVGLFYKAPAHIDSQIIHAKVLVGRPALENRESTRGERAAEHVKRPVAHLGCRRLDRERPTRRLHAQRFGTREQNLHFLAAGCCCVRQCKVPSPQTRSTAWIPVTVNLGNASAIPLSATRSFGSLRSEERRGGKGGSRRRTQ